MPGHHTEYAFETAIEHHLITSGGYEKEDREMTRTDALIEKIWESIIMLRKYRTALISAAVTGRIDVRGEKV